MAEFFESAASAGGLADGLAEFDCGGQVGIDFVNRLAHFGADGGSQNSLAQLVFHLVGTTQKCVIHVGWVYSPTITSHSARSTVGEHTHPTQLSTPMTPNSRLPFAD
jgi:hypothetical protein